MEWIREQTSWADGRAPLRWVLPLLAIALLIGVELRQHQAQRMHSAPATFLVEGELAVTTPDAGYFLQVAQRYAQSGRWVSDPVGRNFPNEFDPAGPQSKASIENWGSFQPGLGLPWALAHWHTLRGISLEQAGFELLLAGVITTALAAFLFFAALGQPLYGTVAALAAVVAWPTAFRMTVGMIDTDIFNAAFFFAVLATLVHAVQRPSTPRLLLWSGLAGLLNLGLFFWYGKAAFLLMFSAGFIALLIAYRWPWRAGLLAVSVFILASHPLQLPQAVSGALGFEQAYVGIANEFDQAIFRDLFGAIGEVTRPSAPLLGVFFGSLTVYLTCLAGTALWCLQDWRRAAAALPIGIFILLFHISGVRFGYYVTPLLWVGFVVGIIAMMVQLERLIGRARGSLSPRGLRRLTRAAAVIFVTLGLSAAALPRTYLSPPTLYPDEVALLRSIPATRPAAVVVSNWSLGYLIGYYTELSTFADPGSGGTSLKAMLFAYAARQQDPETSAAWMRRAAYFSERALLEAYPSLPRRSQAIGTDRDVYLLTSRVGMPEYRAAWKRLTAAIPAERLDEPLPRLGNNPFQLIGQSAGGARLFRLAAPQDGAW